MSKRIPLRLEDLRGVGRLAVEATLGITELIENLHLNIARLPGPFAAASEGSARGISGVVYRSIRGVTRLVGGGIDLALKPLAALLGPATSSSDERDVVLAALNGVLGDHLASTGNPLAIRMGFFRDGAALPTDRQGLQAAIPQARGKIVLLLHGLCMNDRQWRRNDHDHGAALANDAHYTAVYLRYNSGLHVSTNGRELAALIEELLQTWPVAVTEVVLLAHSMGGLLARSACFYARSGGLKWPRQVRAMIFLGTPHHGAPLERGGHWIDKLLGASPYTSAFARLGKIRSAGITDLRHGSIVDEDWQGRDRFTQNRAERTHVKLPEDIPAYAIAASRSRKAPVSGRRALSDGLVPVASALGCADDEKSGLHVTKARTWIGYGMNHMDLLDRAEVYATILRWLVREPSRPRTETP